MDLSQKPLRSIRIRHTAADGTVLSDHEVMVGEGIAHQASSEECAEEYAAAANRTAVERGLANRYHAIGSTVYRAEVAE